MQPISEKDGAVRISLYVQPRASRTEVVGVHGDTIKLRVAAPPVDGAANEEVRRFLAKAMDVAMSAVVIVHGDTGRRKMVEVTGVSAAEARLRLGLSLSR
ncbi:MAG TPA: DUF167 family protein [Longimicrobiales bacterium]